MPETPKTLFAQGLALLKAQRSFEAVAVFDSLRTAAPDYPGLNEAYVKALRRDARHEEGLAFSESATGDPVQLGFERAMCLLALGRAETALCVFDGVLALNPNMAVAWYQSHGPALDLNGQDDAMRRIERALACQGPVNGNYRALLAAYHFLRGDEGQARKIARKARHRVLIDGIAALKPHFAPNLRLFGVSAHLHSHALDRAELPGLVLEFGVRRGTSLRLIAHRAKQEIHGFDSFEGLPESWGSIDAGQLTTGSALPDVPSNAHLHPGWFEDTLPFFLKTHDGPVRFVNIDSDLYVSARTVLFALAPRLVPGSILVFDELIGNPTWHDDEFKALSEFAQAIGARYEVFALAPATKQAALRIL